MAWNTNFNDALVIGQMNREETSDLLEKSIERLRKEETILRINSKSIVVVGDTHGDLETSSRVLDDYLKDGETILFLGDYVDRGTYQLENVNFLLKLKEERNTQLFLLRGNHETPSVNKVYGFYETVEKKFNREMYELYCNVFSELPYVALINGKFLALHGGLPSRTKDLTDLQKTLRKGIREPVGDIIELLWNDPSDGLTGYAESPRGIGPKIFGRDVAMKFLDNSQVSTLIRSHTPEISGYKFLWNRRLLTIFSCRFYGIRPAIAKLENGNLTACNI